MTSFNNQTQNCSFSEGLPQKIFNCNEIIPSRNDVLWRIDSGAVRTVTFQEDGNLVTLGYWGIGDVIGYPLSKVNPYQMECVTTTTVTILPPHCWSYFTNSLFSHIQDIKTLLNIVNNKEGYLKIWLILIWLSEKFGSNVEYGKQIDIKLTHQDLAEVLNTSRVTVTRMLKQMEKEGKIMRCKRKIIVIRENERSN